MTKCRLPGRFGSKTNTPLLLPAAAHSEVEAQVTNSSVLLVMGAGRGRP